MSERRRRSPSPRRHKHNRREEDDDDGKYKFPSPPREPTAPKVQPKQRDFKQSGKLTEDNNPSFNGRKLLWSEPPDSVMPKGPKWRMYVFKGAERIGEPIILKNQTCFLLGRDRGVADIPLDHPSCSSQHAVIQFREVSNQTRPYIMDLESTNGTILNSEPLRPRVYVEIKPKDVIKFAFSTREYVFLREDS